MPGKPDTMPKVELIRIPAWFCSKHGKQTDAFSVKGHVLCLECIAEFAVKCIGEMKPNAI